MRLRLLRRLLQQIVKIRNSHDFRLRLDEVVTIPAPLPNCGAPPGMPYDADGCALYLRNGLKHHRKVCVRRFVDAAHMLIEAISTTEAHRTPTGARAAWRGIISAVASQEQTSVHNRSEERKMILYKRFFNPAMQGGHQRPADL